MHDLYLANERIFTELACRPIQSISCNVRLYVFLAPSAGTRNHVDWRLLVEEVIAKSAKIRTLFGRFAKKIVFDFFGVFGV